MMSFYRFTLVAFVVLSACSIAARADECDTTPGNLVSNCGFEAGTFSGWTLTGVQSSSAYLGISHGVDAADAYAGTEGAYFAGFGGVLTLTQTLPTVPGSTYRISYWLAHSPATVPPYVSSLVTTFGSAMLSSATNVGELAYGFYSFSAAASQPFTTLSFAARDDTGFFLLDDVTVTLANVPEPGSAGFLAVGLAVAAAVLSFRLSEARQASRRRYQALSES